MKLPRVKLEWKRTKRRKRFLFFLLILIGVILLYRFALLPLVESQRQIREEISLKRNMLLRYDEYIHTGKDVEEELNRVTQEIKAIESKLLPGETPQINAANLQEILKKLAEKNGIQIRSFRIGEPKETNFYLKIPVVIDINPSRSMASLTYFLFDIENYEKLLVVSDLDLTAPNMRNPTEVQGSLTVVGFTKNLRPKAKTRESS